MTAVVSGKYPGNDNNELLFTCTLTSLPGSLVQVQERGHPKQVRVNNIKIRVIREHMTQFNTRSKYTYLP